MKKNYIKPGFGTQGVKTAQYLLSAYYGGESMINHSGRVDEADAESKRRIGGEGDTGFGSNDIWGNMDE